MEKIRLDTYIQMIGLAPSRSKASELIHKGKIMVDNKIIIKPSFEVDEENDIKILENEVLKYVSRGGLKLEKALTYFNLTIDNYVILDIGASTGGFTDCALQNGAKKVYSLDVGTSQLHYTLINNERVINLENLNFKDLTHEMINDHIDLYVCDVSFISIETILKKLQNFDNKFTIIILYKPQFEVGKQNLNKKGVVKNQNIVIKYLEQFFDFLKINNIGVLNFTYSPIIGQKEGNIEFLFLLKNKEISKSFDINKIVNEAYKVLKVK